MSTGRIKVASLLDKVMTAAEAAQLFENGMVVGSSGFTKAGDSKEVLPAFAKRAENEDIQITLMTGASLGHGTDGKLAAAGALKNACLSKWTPLCAAKSTKARCCS